ncbi:hypothetical protein GCM10010344_39140 [Streptomyces bluensis]|nr:hypothetical protein GCM10010344_39140 [Streptomyces bluensis]
MVPPQAEARVRTVGLAIGRAAVPDIPSVRCVGRAPGGLRPEAFADPKTGFGVIGRMTMARD